MDGWEGATQPSPASPACCSSFSHSTKISSRIPELPPVVFLCPRAALFFSTIHYIPIVFFFRFYFVYTPSNISYKHSFFLFRLLKAASSPLIVRIPCFIDLPHRLHRLLLTHLPTWYPQSLSSLPTNRHRHHH